MPTQSHRSTLISISRPSCKCRRGVSAVESSVVLGLVILAALASLHTLSSTVQRGFSSVCMEVDDIPAAVSSNDTAIDSRLAQTDTRATASHDNTADFAVAICVFSLVIIGALYFRLWRKRSGDLQGKEDAVAEIHQRSKALRQVLAKRNSIFNRIDDNWESILGGNSRVGSYMSTNVMAIAPDVPKAEALAKMQDAGYRRFMVRRKDGSLAGVVSRKDILSKPGDLVCDVMTDKPRIATPDCEVHTALSVLLENRISCLPIVKDDMLVGLLSVSDLLMMLQCLLRDLSTRDIDPAFVEAQAMHDRCELVPETDPAQRLEKYASSVV